MATVQDVKKRNVQLRLAFKRLSKSPDYQVIVDWVEGKFNGKMLPSGPMTLERLAGQRDVFRDMRMMMQSEVSDETIVE